jgi:hypothetical protein
MLLRAVFFPLLRNENPKEAAGARVRLFRTLAFPLAQRKGKLQKT